MTAHLVDTFTQKYESLSGRAHLADGAAAVAKLVSEIAHDASAECLALAGLPEPLERAIEQACEAHSIRVIKSPYASADMPDAIDGVQVGVTSAAFAVADVGALVEVATDDAWRLVSTLPRIHIGIVHEESLVQTLEEAAPHIRDAFEQNTEHCAVTFISGPSRTADIEMKLTLGVHGPEQAHAIIVQGDSIL